ncbi:MAG TPA: DUF167 domain-containing protein [Armatimonadota bacterium]|jgi:hypothetical protein
MNEIVVSNPLTSEKMTRTLINVRVNPRSSRNQVTGWQDDTVSIKLTAPPVEGAANKAAAEFLAEKLSLKKSQVNLVSGPASREKVFEIDGLSIDEIRQRLTRT